MGNTPPKPTLKQQLRQNKRELDKAIRELDRERTQLERQKTKLETDIRKNAQAGNTSVVRVMAKDYVRTKKYIQKFHEMKAQLQAVSLRMQVMKSHHAMGEAMKGASKSMVQMSRAMNLPQLQRIVRTFAVESERMEMTQEVMSDTIDDVMEEEGDEEEEEAIVGAVMQELNLSMMEDAPTVPVSGAAEAVPSRSAVATGGPPDESHGDGGDGPPGAAGGGGGGGGASLSELEQRLRNLRDDE